MTTIRSIIAICLLAAAAAICTALGHPGGARPDAPPPAVQPPATVEAVAYINMRTIGRAPEPYWTTEQTREEVYARMSDRRYNRCLLHMPQGWVNTMAGGAWYGMSEEYRQVYADVIGRVLAERPGYKVTLYTGGQFYSAYSIVGRPRPPSGQGYIGEPHWLDPDDPRDVRGIRDLTLQPWADIGVSGVVFDSGSKFPADVVRWKSILDQMSTVGLEAIPWDDSTGSVDWSYCEAGLEYHANQRFRNGRPFLETVPKNCRGRAFVWLVHDLDPTAQEVSEMMQRGWTPVVLWRRDELYAQALAIHRGQ